MFNKKYKHNKSDLEAMKAIKEELGCTYTLRDGSKITLAVRKAIKI